MYNRHRRKHDASSQFINVVSDRPVFKISQMTDRETSFSNDYNEIFTLQRPLHRKFIHSKTDSHLQVTWLDELTLGIYGVKTQEDLWIVSRRVIYDTFTTAYTHIQPNSFISKYTNSHTSSFKTYKRLKRKGNPRIS